jgi:hypothetical protein
VRYYSRAGEPMTFDEWVEAFESRTLGDNGVAVDELEDGAYISTVWLGLDHSFGGPVPLIFETMVFGGPHDGFCERYATEEQARAGHRRALAAIRQGQDPEEQ